MSLRDIKTNYLRKSYLLSEKDTCYGLDMSCSPPKIMCLEFDPPGGGDIER
jgi:hypothetical protein